MTMQVGDLVWSKSFERVGIIHTVFPCILDGIILVCFDDGEPRIVYVDVEEVICK